MKNKTLAIYGIGTYILSVITSTSDIEGNPVFPVAVILISGFAGFLFFIMATIRLWNHARNVVLIYMFSTIILIILSVIQEITSPTDGSPIIILLNVTKIIHFIAFVWAVLALIIKPRIEGHERERCLAYITETVTNITAFLDRESTLFNNTLVKYLDSISESPLAASKICSAANRLVQAAQEVIHRHDLIQPIPKAAFPMYYAYSTLFLRAKEWAESTLAAMEALANDMTPHYEYVQHLMDKRESAWHEAYCEEKKLLKQLGLTESEVEAIPRQTHSILEAAKEDSWHPEPCSYVFTNEAK